jgi:hypothetical protein
MPSPLNQYSLNQVIGVFVGVCGGGGVHIDMFADYESGITYLGFRDTQGLAGTQLGRIH